MSGQSSAPVRFPDDAWRDTRMSHAWRRNDFRSVFVPAGRFGLTPQMIADNTGLPLDLVVNVMKGNTAPGFSSGAVESIAKGFGMPDDMRGAFGLAPRKASPAIAWSARIRSERKKRGWPVRKLAELLRSAADDPDNLPPVYALVTMIREVGSRQAGAD